MPWLLWIQFYLKEKSLCRDSISMSRSMKLKQKEAEGLIGKSKSPLSHVPFKNATAPSELGLQIPLVCVRHPERNHEPNAVSWVGRVVNLNPKHLSLPWPPEYRRVWLYKPSISKCLQGEVETIIWYEQYPIFKNKMGDPLGIQGLANKLSKIF